MDKTVMSNTDKLKICRRYHNLGYYCLPVLWCVNYFWFREEANSDCPFEEQEEIRKLVKRSGIGAAIWMVIATVWVIVFQTQRVSWGEFGDSISFTIPSGSL